MRLLMTILLAISSILIANPMEAAPRPVIVIPGIMGSKLCDGAGHVVWGDRASYTYARINALRLPFDVGNRDKSIHSCGLIESVAVIPLLWESNIYSELLMMLRKPDMGYSDNEIITFHYDWRLSNFDNASKLHDEIERRFPSANQRVDLVAHSMGGLIARIYVQRLGGEVRVQNLIMFGTPHRGSAKIFARLRDGFDNWPSALSGGLPEIQRTILSFPSTYQLLPTYNECCGFSAAANPVTAQYADILDPLTWSRFTWLPSEYKMGPGQQFLSKSLSETKRLKSLLAEPIFKDSANNSKLHFVANGFLDTWSRVFFDPTTGLITGNTFYKGDGTVLLESATNGVPSQVQISLREHELIYSGREPELILKAALSDQI